MQAGGVLFVLALLTIAAINVLAVERRQIKTRAREGERLRLGLKAEMEGLVDLLDASIETLNARGDRQFAASRGSDIFFRTNSSRLASSLDDDITAVVRAYSSFEATDKVLASVARPLGPAAYQLGENVEVGAVRERFLQSRDSMLAAIAAVEAFIPTATEPTLASSNRRVVTDRPELAND